MTNFGLKEKIMTNKTLAPTISSHQKMMATVVFLAIVCCAALWLGGLFPLLGGPVLAILTGASLAPLALKSGIVPYCQKVSKYALLGSVVMLGLGMNISQVVSIGGSSIGFMVTTVTFALLASWFFSRLLRLHGNTATLVGAGTCICGGSAIAAMSGIIHAKEEETAQALSTIFLFNIIAAVLFPLLGHLMGVESRVFGLWAGTAINDTSSVLAAAFSYGGESGDVGTVVKMARTLMIFPLGIVIALRQRFYGQQAGSWKRTLPLPAIGFALAIGIRVVVGDSGAPLWEWATTAGKWLMVLALAAIGLITHLGHIWHNGRRALAVGALTWAALSLFSLSLIHLFELGA